MEKNSSDTSKHEYSTKQADQLIEKVQKLRNENAGVRLNISALASQLTNERARTFANEGIGRRLPIIERCVTNIFRIYPPSRKEFLGENELSDIAIQLHAFSINVYALLDNIVWVCVLEKGMTEIKPLDVGLFKKKSQLALPRALTKYLAQPTVANWFDSYGKPYRDSTAHRIASYLPSRTYTSEQAVEYRESDRLAKAAFRRMTDLNEDPLPSMAEMQRRLDEFQALVAEREKIGSNSLLVAISESESDGRGGTDPVYLHPQLQSDWSLVLELLTEFAHTLRTERGWPEPAIPLITVS